MNPENWMLGKSFEPEFRVFSKKVGAEFRIEYLRRWEILIQHSGRPSHTHICQDCGRWADICTYNHCSPNKCWYCSDCCKEN